GRPGAGRAGGHRRAGGGPGGAGRRRGAAGRRPGSLPRHGAAGPRRHRRGPFLGHPRRGDAGDAASPDRTGGDIVTSPLGRLRPLMGDLLVTDGLRLLAVNVAGAGLAFLSHILFARWLSVASYGAYVVALSWLNILFILVQAGLNVALIRLVAEA